jgi:hypothetical protein
LPPPDEVVVGVVVVVPVVPGTVTVTVCVVVAVGTVYVTVEHADFGVIVPTFTPFAEIVCTGDVAHTDTVPVVAAASANPPPPSKSSPARTTRSRFTQSLLWA